jgi:hypothetical protein
MNTYRVTVYERDHQGILHLYANYDIEAESPGEAKYQALLRAVTEEDDDRPFGPWKVEIFDDQQKAKP